MPSAISTMTKTEARELKSLVKSDFATLETRVDSRYHDMQSKLKQERLRRNQEIQKAARKELSSLRAQYTRLANKTQETLDELTAQGWAASNFRIFECKFNIDNIKPPNYDKHEDLDEEQDLLYDRYRSVKEGLQDEKSRLLRQLVLNTLKTDEAKAFLSEIPTAEDVLPTPDFIKALELPAPAPK